MRIDPELAQIIVCPKCKTTLSLCEEFINLKCENCKQEYPLEDDIPILIKE